MIHLDVMDGRFVPNITFGEKMIDAVRKLTTLPLEVHMMVEEPERYFRILCRRRRERHDHSRRSRAAPPATTGTNPRARLRAGAAVKPGTSIISVREVLADLDNLLVMTVNPASAVRNSFPRHPTRSRVRATCSTSARSRAALEVDGGISRDTIASVWRAGADTFVAGNAIFSADDPRAEIGALRNICMETV
jgi:ribulose-phosphate 3-epimerase